MFKKFWPCMLLAVLLACPAPLAARADEGDMDREVLAPTFVLIDAADPETFLYAKDPDKRIAPASTTKIMTCILALEHCTDLNEIVEVPDVATRLKSTNTLMGLRKGESLPLIDLLYGLMLPSGNDAAITVAYHVAGDVEQFAALMNEKAAALHMDDTHFVNASGVFKGEHYSTARDMARLAAYAMQNETFRQIVATAEYTVPANDVRQGALHLVNTNRLVSDPTDSSFYYEYAIGCKTGSTAKGGKCLVAAAEKDGVTLIAVLLGLKEGGDRGTRIRRCFSDAKMLFETAYDTMYAPVTAETLGCAAYTTEIQVENPRLTDEAEGLLELRADLSGQSVTMRTALAEAVQADPALLTAEVALLSEPVAAPVAEGEVLGSVTFSCQGAVLFTADLTAARAVEAYDPADEPTPTPAPTAAPVSIEQSFIGKSLLSGSKTVYLLLAGAGLVVIGLIVAIVLLARRGKNK